MKLAFLAHPLRGDTTENLARAMRWYKWCCDHYPDMNFEATWMLNCIVYNDSNPVERIKGMERARASAARCDELWLVGGAISEGMALEVGVMNSLGRPVIDLTMIGPEPPSGPLDQWDGEPTTVDSSMLWK